MKSTPQWKEYEKLIGEIERHWVEKKAIVTRNAEVPDLTTGTKREVDILIQTTVGSATINVGIECRKRGARGDITWIEQLSQKKQSLGLARMIAVSHAGFTKEAQTKARQLGIELRLASSLSGKNVANIFDSVHLTMRRFRFKLEKLSVTLKMKTVPGMPQLQFERMEGEKDPKNIFFAQASDGSKRSIFTIIEHFANVDPDIVRQTQAKKIVEEVRKTIIMEPADPITCETGYGRFPCTHIRAVIHAVPEVITTELSKKFSYSEVGVASPRELYCQAVGEMKLDEKTTLNFIGDFHQAVQIAPVEKPMQGEVTGSADGNADQRKEGP